MEKTNSEVAFLSLTSAAGYVPPVHLPSGHNQTGTKPGGYLPSGSGTPQTPQTPDSGMHVKLFLFKDIKL